ncbi:MAG TPA: anhydro-N-acetylmuramic acid kinase [Gemmatimonadota bacterium]|nr:anhydro-N-acetylmuramic acid kinase [Gemmatimonadota bacterium]
MPIDPRHPLLPSDPPSVVIGLMSGTSGDGVDAACCRLSHPEGEGLAWEVLGTAGRPYDEELAATILRTPRLRPPELAALHGRLGAEFAGAAAAAAEAAGITLDEVDLIGSHGHTAWHDPRGIHGGVPVTLQIGSAAEIAERTGVAVWSDFRSADVAAGGEGAPFVPLVDWLLFRSADVWRVCLNLGGIGNVTLLPPGVECDRVIAFDTGPGNVVLDRLARRVLGLQCDHDGEMAAGGQVDSGRLEAALTDPFFALPAPKSTGPEWFDDVWVERYFSPLEALAPDGVRERFATAAGLTVESVARALEGQASTSPVPEDAEVLVAGGGRRNRAILDGLRRRLAPRTVVPVDDRGLDGDFKEAVAFAVLAYESALGRAVNLPSATGARRSVRCGQLAFPSSPGPGQRVAGRSPE